MGRDSLSAVFAKVLRREREAKGLSQEALAHVAGVHRTYVSKLILDASASDFQKANGAPCEINALVESSPGCRLI